VSGAAPYRAPGGAPRIAFCVGAQKAGTTWLHAYYASHPEMHVPSVKEMHYFDGLYGPERDAVVERRRRRAAEQKAPCLAEIRAKLQGRLPYPSPAYNRVHLDIYFDDSGTHRRYWELLTDGRGDEPCAMDITPSYALIGAEGFAEILRVWPEARFVYLIRDPVARAWSSLRMAYLGQGGKRDRGVPLTRFVRDFLDGKQQHIHRRNDYAATVRALDAVVPPDQVHYAFYETLFTPEAVAALNRFLGVGAYPADFSSVVRPGQDLTLPAELQAALRAQAAPIYEFLRDRFGSALPAAYHLAPTAGAAE